jgi:diaminohydroxyphosphoribosylaminopyrimidine deaminase/5-amino-6-(5-phosphoribosylamino)uracil reductase
VSGANQKRRAALAARGVEIWDLPVKRGKVTPRALLERLATEGLLHLMVEGGAQVASTFLAAGLVDALWLFVAPKILGADGVGWSPPLGLSRVAQAQPWITEGVERLGDDVLLTLKARPRHEASAGLPRASGRAGTRSRG